MKIKNGEVLKTELRGSESRASGLNYAVVDGDGVTVEAGGLRVRILGKDLGNGIVEVPRRNLIGEKVSVRLAKPGRRERQEFTQLGGPGWENG